MAKTKARRLTRRQRVASAREQPVFDFGLPGDYERRDGKLYNRPHPFDLVGAFQVACALCAESGPRPRDFAIAYLHQHVSQHHRGEAQLRVALTLERG